VIEVASTADSRGAPGTLSGSFSDDATAAARADPHSADAPAAVEPNAGGPRGPKPKQQVQMMSDRILVQIPRGDGERRSRSGILIPATAQVGRRLAWAEVVAVGPHVRSVKPGDQVLFNAEDRYEVEMQGEEYLILRERDISAVASERVESGTGLYL
jgi:chaperonin GroES